MDLSGRHFLKEFDYSVDEWHYLLDLSAQLKAQRAAGTEKPYLLGKSIALLFEKTSTRTRTAFEVAAYEQGAHVTMLDPASSQLGHKESAADTARVLSRIYSGIQFRGNAHATVETLAAYSLVPVWNGLTDDWHPTQSLCDMLTMREHSPKPDGEIAFAYLGDARNNVANSLLVAGAMMGMDVRLVAPLALQPMPEIVAAARSMALVTGARITVTDDIDAGIEDCDFLYTDVWVSMGEPKALWLERIELLSDYQISVDLLARTGNPAVKVMHCLPAFHDLETSVGAEIGRLTGRTALEISHEVFESQASIVFDQSENRMHTIKAIMVATAGRI